MILDHQNQFREEYIKPLKAEKPKALPPGYAELYATWAEKNKNILYQLSDEEMTKSFSDFVATETKKQITNLIDKKQVGREAKRHLKQLAIRGQILLASKDGKNFDQLITPEDIQKGQAKNYTILSPTFRTTTTDLREVLDEQSLLHITTKLRNQQFTIQSAWIDKNHQVHAEIVPRGGITEVVVDLSQDASTPLVYNFIDQDGGVRRVAETQLPEEFSDLPVEPSLETPSKEALIASHLAGGSPEDAAVAATNAALAATAATNAANIANKVNAESAAQAQEATQRQMEAPLLDQSGPQLSNVMASKAAVKTRMARQKKKLENERERQAEFEKRRDKDQKEWREKQAAEAKATQARKEKQKKRLLKGGAVGAGLAGLVGGTAAGTTLFINNINLFS